MRSIWLALAVASVGLTGCFPKAGQAPGPLSTEAVTRAKSRWPDSSPEALEDGRKQFLEHCDTCHSYPDLAHYGDEKWPGIMEKMGKKAKLSSEQTEGVLRFILTARQLPGTAPKALE